MSEKFEIPAYLAKAAELFFEELGGHVSAIESLVANANSEVLPADVTAEISKRFHTIRGGAAFLKIENIAGPAKTGEAETISGQVSATRVRELLTQIKAAL